MSKKIITILSIFLIVILNCGTVYGEYDREKAAEYAQKYAKDGNSYFYEFGADCTNFVSQAEAVAGIYSYIPSKYPSAPNVFKKYVADSNENSWYMIYKERFIGFDYYIYSKSWACVRDFRNYFSKSNVVGSNDRAKVTNYKLYQWDIAKDMIKIGDVLQYDQNGKAHSIIITKKTASSFKYCAHSSDRYNEDISTFYNYMRNNNITNFYVISYK